MTFPLIRRARSLMINRRVLLAGLTASVAAACNQTAQSPAPLASATGTDDLANWYIGSIPDKPHNIPLVDRSRIRPDLNRQVVEYAGSERPGTIVVDIDKRHLFLVEEGGRATRYGIGVGRNGFSWSGVATVGRKGVWPNWGPTGTMLRIKPDLPRYMDGGLNNPLGARALYLYQGGRDTMFRIHGTNEPWSIGDAVSSGCVRMLNEDVVDLYNRVPVGTTVLVRRHGRFRV